MVLKKIIKRRLTKMDIWMVYRNELPHNRTGARSRKRKGKILIPVKALGNWLVGKEVKS